MQIRKHIKNITNWKIIIFQNIAVREKDHFFLWIPFLLGLGIAFYFGNTTEPPVWMGLTCLFISGVTTYYYRSYYKVFLSTLIATIVFAGFSSAQLRTHFVNTNMLPKSFGPAGIQGRIAKVQNTEKGMKVVLKDLQIARMRADHVPTSVRLHINSRKTIVKTGDWIEARAALKPPPAPSAPDSFDFQRHSYFKGIGAIGFVYGDVRVLNNGSQTVSTITGFFDEIRAVIQQRINIIFANQPDERALAIAFLTGNKQTIAEVTHEKIRAAGLAHLLAISGLHIGLVASMVFFTLRFIFAHIPFIALNFPLKKTAALCAIAGALFFTLLTGASIPTIRAFIMTTIVLSGVLLDRKAISLRTVAWAAIAILLIYPESLLGPSFQLSFAAVIALVAFYEKRRTDPTSNKTFQYLKGVFSSSLIATAATMPFAAYHFNRIALYGIGSNLLAVPLTVFWVMPFGVLSLLLMPFGLEDYTLKAMGWGITGLLWIADETAALPFAQISIPAVSNLSLALLTIGGLILCLMRSKLRRLSFVPICLALIIAYNTQSPDILIRANGKLNAIKSENGAVMMSNIRHAAYVRSSWMKRWGEEHQSPSKMQNELPCDKGGCTYSHSSGIQVIFNNHPMALTEDCQNADILITKTSSPSICSNPYEIIDQYRLKTQGAQAIYLKNKHIVVTSDKHVRGTRPWTVYGQ